MAVSGIATPNEPLRRALTHALAFWAVAAPLWVLVGAAVDGTFAVDFHHAFLPAARAVLHGASPFHPLGPHPTVGWHGFLYPPLSAYLVVPFTVLPTWGAEILAAALAAAAVPAALWLLGVRDWRCYAIAFLWPPTIVGVQTANLTLTMLLGVALVWRYRDRAVIAPLAAAAVVALKLFFWPLLVWFVVSRRYRSAALAAAATAVLVLAPWAGIGFAGLRDYPGRLSTLSRVEGAHSYSLAALLHSILSSWTAAVAVAAVVGLAMVVLACVAGRRGRERDAFALVLLAVLALTPLVEMHYVAVLLVLVALYRPRLSLAWAAPCLIWGAPGSSPISPLQAAHVLVVVALTVYLAYTGWEPRGYRLAPWRGSTSERTACAVSSANR